MRGTVTEEIIQTICNLGKTSLANIRKEIQVQEPIFDKWAKNSVREDLNNIKFSGVAFHSDEAARYVGAVLLQAKCEGFLICAMAQDKEWCDQFSVDSPEKNDDVPYRRPIMACMEGRLDAEVYDRIKKSMTKEEKAAGNTWKHKAIEAHEKFTELKNAGKAAKKFLQEDAEKKRRSRRRDEGSKPKSGDDGDVDITP